MVGQGWLWILAYHCISKPYKKIIIYQMKQTFILSASVYAWGSYSDKTGVKPFWRITWSYIAKINSSGTISVWIFPTGNMNYSEIENTLPVGKNDLWGWMLSGCKSTESHVLFEHAMRYFFRYYYWLFWILENGGDMVLQINAYRNHRHADLGLHLSSSTK